MASAPVTTPPASPAPVPGTTRTPGVARRNLADLGDLSGFSLAALKEVPRSAIYTAEILRQLAILVRYATFFIAALCFFIGFSQTTYGYYVLASFGAVDYAGAFTGIISPRISMALTYGYGFAAIIGCSLVAEIGAMKVNEELDAYEAEGVNPVRYVVATRIVAAILYAPLVAAIALVAGAVGSMLNLTVIAGDMNPATFWRYHWGLQSIPDLVFAVISLTVLGVVIAIVGCYYGFRARGGPAGIGTAVARSLVINLPLVHAITGLSEFAVYGEGLDLKLPIGG